MEDGRLPGRVADVEHWLKENVRSQTPWGDLAERCRATDSVGDILTFVQAVCKLLDNKRQESLLPKNKRRKLSNGVPEQDENIDLELSPRRRCSLPARAERSEAGNENGRDRGNGEQKPLHASTQTDSTETLPRKKRRVSHSHIFENAPGKMLFVDSDDNDCVEILVPPRDVASVQAAYHAPTVEGEADASKQGGSDEETAASSGSVLQSDAGTSPITLRGAAFMERLLNYADWLVEAVTALDNHDDPLAELLEISTGKLAFERLMLSVNIACSTMSRGLGPECLRTPEAFKGLMLKVVEAIRDESPTQTASACDCRRLAQQTASSGAALCSHCLANGTYYAFYTDDNALGSKGKGPDSPGDDWSRASQKAACRLQGRMRKALLHPQDALDCLFKLGNMFEKFFTRRQEGICNVLGMLAIGNDLKGKDFCTEFANCFGFTAGNRGVAWVRLAMRAIETGYWPPSKNDMSVLEKHPVVLQGFYLWRPTLFVQEKETWLRFKEIVDAQLKLAEQEEISALIEKNRQERLAAEELVRTRNECDKKLSIAREIIQFLLKSGALYDTGGLYNPIGVLGVPPSITEHQLKKVKQKVMLLIHPDKLPVAHLPPIDQSNWTKSANEAMKTFLKAHAEALKALTSKTLHWYQAPRHLAPFLEDCGITTTKIAKVISTSEPEPPPTNPPTEVLKGKKQDLDWRLKATWVRGETSTPLPENLHTPHKPWATSSLTIDRVELNGTVLKVHLAATVAPSTSKKPRSKLDRVRLYMFPPMILRGDWATTKKGGQWCRFWENLMRRTDWAKYVLMMWNFRDCPVEGTTSGLDLDIAEILLSPESSDLILTIGVQSVENVQHPPSSPTIFFKKISSRSEGSRSESHGTPSKGLVDIVSSKQMRALLTLYHFSPDRIYQFPLNKFAFDPKATKKLVDSEVRKLYKTIISGTRLVDQPPRI